MKNLNFKTLSVSQMKEVKGGRSCGPGYLDYDCKISYGTKSHSGIMCAEVGNIGEAFSTLSRMNPDANISCRKV